MRLFLFPLLLFSLLACGSKPDLDVLIRGGLVVDGSGAPAYPADLGIRGDSIVAIATSLSPDRAKRVIDAAGYVLAPGFVDPHAHVERDLMDPERKSNTAYLYQGVTTVIFGNDGGGPLAVDERMRTFEAGGLGTNAGMLVGHNSLRRRVMGQADRAPTSEEMEAMKTLLEQGLEAGALGLSAGLFYSPGHFADTDEVVELARVAAAHDGVYDVHQRDESSYNIGLVKAVEETIAIAERAGVRANISHVKALGADVWGLSDTIVALVDAARRRGLALTADQYPYRASSTGLAAALLPRWVFADDPDYRPKLLDPDLLPELRKAIAANIARRGGAESLLLTRPSDPSLKGLRLDEIARQRQMPPEQAALEILRAGNSRIASFNMREEDIRHFMRQPWVMTGSDGVEGHPRKYGSYPRKLQRYVLREKLLTLEEMVYRSSLLPATVFGLDRRGRLAPGQYADIIIFRPEAFRETATFEQPSEPAAGMRYVFVNGQLAIDEGQYTGLLAGQALRRKGVAPPVRP